MKKLLLALLLIPQLAFASDVSPEMLLSQALGATLRSEEFEEYRKARGINLVSEDQTPVSASINVLSAEDKKEKSLSGFDYEVTVTYEREGASCTIFMPVAKGKDQKEYIFGAGSSDGGCGE